MSKEEAETDAKKKTNDDLKLQMALEESKREDEQVVNDEVCNKAANCHILSLNVSYLRFFKPKFPGL